MGRESQIDDVITLHINTERVQTFKDKLVPDMNKGITLRELLNYLENDKSFKTNHKSILNNLLLPLQINEALLKIKSLRKGYPRYYSSAKPLVLQILRKYFDVSKFELYSFDTITKHIVSLPENAQFIDKTLAYLTGVIHQERFNQSRQKLSQAFSERLSDNDNEEDITKKLFENANLDPALKNYFLEFFYYNNQMSNVHQFVDYTFEDVDLSLYRPFNKDTTIECKDGAIYLTFKFQAESIIDKAQLTVNKESIYQPRLSNIFESITLKIENKTPSKEEYNYTGIETLIHDSSLKIYEDLSRQKFLSLHINKSIKPKLLGDEPLSKNELSLIKSYVDFLKKNNEVTDFTSEEIFYYAWYDFRFASQLLQDVNLKSMFLSSPDGIEKWDAFERRHNWNYADKDTYQAVRLLINEAKLVYEQGKEWSIYKLLSKGNLYIVPMLLSNNNYPDYYFKHEFLNYLSGYAIYELAIKDRTIAKSVFKSNVFESSIPLAEKLTSNQLRDLLIQYPGYQNHVFADSKTRQRFATRMLRNKLTDANYTAILHNASSSEMRKRVKAERYNKRQGKPEKISGFSGMYVSIKKLFGYSIAPCDIEIDVRQPYDISMVEEQDKPFAEEVNRLLGLVYHKSIQEIKEYINTQYETGLKTHEFLPYLKMLIEKGYHKELVEVLLDPNFTKQYQSDIFHKPEILEKLINNADIKTIIRFLSLDDKLVTRDIRKGLMRYDTEWSIDELDEKNTFILCYSLVKHNPSDLLIEFFTWRHDIFAKVIDELKKPEEIIRDPAEREKYKFAKEKLNKIYEENVRLSIKTKLDMYVVNNEFKLMSDKYFEDCERQHIHRDFIESVPMYRTFLIKNLTTKQLKSLLTFDDPEKVGRNISQALIDALLTRNHTWELNCLITRDSDDDHENIYKPNDNKFNNQYFLNLTKLMVRLKVNDSEIVQIIVNDPLVADYLLLNSNVVIGEERVKSIAAQVTDITSYDKATVHIQEAYYKDNILVCTNDIKNIISDTKKNEEDKKKEVHDIIDRSIRLHSIIHHSHSRDFFDVESYILELFKTLDNPDDGVDYSIQKNY